MPEAEVSPPMAYLGPHRALRNSRYLLGKGTQLNSALASSRSRSDSPIIGWTLYNWLLRFSRVLKYSFPSI